MEYGKLIREGALCLKEALTDNPDALLDARLLLEKVCGTTRETYFSHPEREVTSAEEEVYRSYIARRAKHEPTAYILGEQYFMGLPFAVSRDVLIPNQDTENLVEEAMSAVHDGMRILDLCTGSGCILLSLLHYSNGTEGVMTDLSSAALTLADKNAAALGLSERVKSYRGDLYGALPENMDKFHVVVSNPPYIPTAVIETLAPEVKEGEPYMALDGGEDGLRFYRQILAGIRKVLVPGGELLVEIGYDQGEAVQKLFDAAGFIETAVVRDYGGRDRIVKGVLGY